MSVSTTENEDQVALIDTTTGTAFGPIFFTNDEAEKFLAYCVEQTQEETAFDHNGTMVRFVDDPRNLQPDELVSAVNTFREEQEEEDD